MDKVTTGTEVIRQALRQRRHKGHLQPLARDLGTSVDVLEVFLSGSHTLGADALQALATELFAGAAVYDATTDRLRPAKAKPALPLGNPPPPFNPQRDLNLGTRGGGPPTLARGPRNGADGALLPVTKIAQRRLAGWAD